jgi:hypothetical protein
LSEKMGARTTAGCIVIFAAIIITETKPTFRRKQNAP